MAVLIAISILVFLCVRKRRHAKPQRDFSPTRRHDPTHPNFQPTIDSRTTAEIYQHFTPHEKDAQDALVFNKSDPIHSPAIHEMESPRREYVPSYEMRMPMKSPAVVDSRVASTISDMGRSETTASPVSTMQDSTRGRFEDIYEMPGHHAIRAWKDMGALNEMDEGNVRNG